MSQIIEFDATAAEAHREFDTNVNCVLSKKDNNVAQHLANAYISFHKRCNTLNPQQLKLVGQIVTQEIAKNPALYVSTTKEGKKARSELFDRVQKDIIRIKTILMQAKARNMLAQSVA